MRITQQIIISNTLIVLSLLLLSAVLIMAMGFFSNDVRLVYVGFPAILLISWIIIIRLITGKS